MKKRNSGVMAAQKEIDKLTALLLENAKNQIEEIRKEGGNDGKKKRMYKR